MNYLGFDEAGNIYLDKDDKIYMFEIDKDNKITLFEVNQNKITKKSDNNIYKKINKQNALHIKTVENAIEEVEEMSDEEREQYADIAEEYDLYKYNPEKRYYHDETYIIDSEDNDDERHIQIYDNYNKLIQISSDFDIPSFETLIINGNENSNNLIFRTEIINDQPLYRITIYTTGIILLNIIGTKIVRFVFDYDKLNFI